MSRETYVALELKPNTFYLFETKAIIMQNSFSSALQVVIVKNWNRFIFSSSLKICVWSMRKLCKEVTFLLMKFRKLLFFRKSSTIFFCSREVLPTEKIFARVCSKGKIFLVYMRLIQELFYSIQFTIYNYKCFSLDLDCYVMLPVVACRV